MINDLVDSAHRLCGRSRLAVLLAMKVRNQADAVVRARFNDGIEMSNNGEAWLIRRVAPHAAFFVDVGANVGAWSIEFLQNMSRAGRGVALEPSPIAAREMRKNLSSRGLTDRLDVLEIAASDQSGKHEFYMEPGAGETSSLVKGHSRSDAFRTKIEVSTIDAIVEERGIVFVDMLKIDAEGFDLRVMRGAAKTLDRQAVRVLQFEYNAPWREAGSTLGEALELLGRSNYKTYLLKADGLHTFDYQTYGEFWGYSNFVALDQRMTKEMSSFLRGPI